MMRPRAGMAALAFLFLIFSCPACRPASGRAAPQFDFNAAAAVAGSNLSHIGGLAGAGGQGTARGGDYYFALIADTQNLVRADDFDRFNLMSRQIMLAEDDGRSVYGQIRFIVLNGDLVYNGADEEQWASLRRAFSAKDYREHNAPYIKMLARDKPILPVLGNHDLMKLRLKPETEYRDLAGSEKGLENFKDFFNWEQFMASGRVLTAIPGEISAPMFAGLLSRLGGGDRERLRSLYAMEGGRYSLRIFQELIARAAADPAPDIGEYGRRFAAAREDVVSVAVPLFAALGYRVLPAVSSDAMICYALEQEGALFLFLDSMARGWHYRNFSRLKKALFKDKKDQHRLNLFTPSPLNGQYEFFRALKEYACRQGLPIALFMHHSPMNSVNNIHGPGIEFNLRLILGLDAGANGPTFWDDLLFSRLGGAGSPPLLSHVFTSCIHYHQRLRIRRRDAGGEMDDLHWHISGGGGGALELTFDDRRLAESQRLYQDALKKRDPGRRFEIVENEVDPGFNFLLVRVKDGRIARIRAVMVPGEKIELRSPSLLQVRASWQAAFFSRPTSMGQLFRLNLLSLGMEWIDQFLQFITLDPAVGIGFLYYNSGGSPAFSEEYAGIFEVSPLDFRLRFPGGKDVTLHLPGLLFVNGEGTHASSYLTVGLDLPLLQHLFERFRRLRLGVKYLFPVRMSRDHDPDFGKRLRFCFYFNYEL
jgi:hypothetical protein